MELLTKSKAFMKGFNHGFINGMFHNSNPYIPGSEEFEDWEAGYKAGYQSQDWL